MAGEDSQAMMMFTNRHSAMMSLHINTHTHTHTHTKDTLFVPWGCRYYELKNFVTFKTLLLGLSLTWTCMAQLLRASSRCVEGRGFEFPRRPKIFSRYRSLQLSCAVPMAKLRNHKIHSASQPFLTDNIAHCVSVV